MAFLYALYLLVCFKFDKPVYWWEYLILTGLTFFTLAGMYIRNKQANQLANILAIDEQNNTNLNKNTNESSNQEADPFHSIT